MRNVLKKKTVGRSGFTLAETLLAILILLLVSGIVVAGIPAAQSAYENVVLASNAELLLSTGISALRNELATAKSIEIEDASISYFNETRSSDSIIYRSTAGSPAIMLRRYASHSEDTGAWLVSETASTQKLYLTYDTVSCSDGIITFGGLRVMNEKTGHALTEREKLSIRVLSE